MSETPARLSADDRLDIMELFARYAWGIDLADADAVVECFAEDAWFDHLWQGRVQGHEAILANLRKLWYDRQAWWIGRQHLFSHYIMWPEGEGARVRTFFQIIQFNVDYGTNFVFGIGTRNDLCVKRDGRWVFQNLYINAWTALEHVPWQGELLIPPKPTAPPPAPPEFMPGGEIPPRPKGTE